MCVEEQEMLNFSNTLFKHLNSVGDMFELWINWYAVNMRNYVSYYCESTLSYLDMLNMYKIIICIWDFWQCLCCSSWCLVWKLCLNPLFTGFFNMELRWCRCLQLTCHKIQMTCRNKPLHCWFLLNCCPHVKIWDSTCLTCE